MAVSKFYLSPLIPPKGSKVKYLNFAITKAVVNVFAEILHSYRGAIDMKHIKQDFTILAKYFMKVYILVSKTGSVVAVFMYSLITHQSKRRWSYAHRQEY